MQGHLVRVRVLVRVLVRVRVRVWVRVWVGGNFRVRGRVRVRGMPGLVAGVELGPP